MGCSFHHWGHRSESFTLLYNMITLLAFTRLTQGTWVRPSSGSSAEKTAPGTWEHPFSASPDPDHNGVVVSPCSGLGRLWAGGGAGRDEALSHSSVLELVFQTSMVWCGATYPNPRDTLQSCTPALVWVHNSSHDLAQLHTNQSFFLSGGSPAFTKLLLVPYYLVIWGTWWSCPTGRCYIQETNNTESAFPARWGQQMTKDKIIIFNSLLAFPSSENVIQCCCRENST